MQNCLYIQTSFCTCKIFPAVSRSIFDWIIKLVIFLQLKKIFYCQFNQFYKKVLFSLSFITKQIKTNSKLEMFEKINNNFGVHNSILFSHEFERKIFPLCYCCLLNPFYFVFVILSLVVFHGFLCFCLIYKLHCELPELLGLHKQQIWTCKGYHGS